MKKTLAIIGKYNWCRLQCIDHISERKANCMPGI